jgi:hypothetical protein
MTDQEQEIEMIPETSPRPFMEIPKLWLKLFQMREDFFAEEAQRASAGNTLIGILISGVFTSIASALSGIIAGLINGSLEYAIGSVVGVACANFFIAPILFYIFNGLNYVVAKQLGGEGDFTSQAYAVSLYAVPISIVSGIVSVFSGIPIIGILAALVTLVIAVAGIYFGIQAFMGVHKLTAGKAAVASIVPALVIGLLLACCIIVALTVMGPVIGEVFQDVINEIQ